MIKEIRYNGYTATPSDYECPDGDLAAVEGLVPEDEALRPVLPPTHLFTLPDGYEVAFIHKNTGYTHYIVIHHTNGGKNIYWIDEPEQSAEPTGINTNLLLSLSSQDIYGFNAVGNTLVILTSDGMHYSLWKGSTYKVLGKHIPELSISFGLQGEMIRGEEFTITFDDIDVYQQEWTDFTDNNKTIITEQVLAKVNKFIAENSTNAGKFMYPFLVRYAYRLYDQSLTMHSAPVLMVCSSDVAPQCFVTMMDGEPGTVNEATLRLASMFHNLDYQVTSGLSALEDWEDIVKSVDIFISKPIYTYDQNGECTRFIKNEVSDCYCICKHTNQAADTTTYPVRYQYNKFSKLYAFTFDPVNFTYPAWRLILPKRDNDAIKADISDNASFYLLKSISIDDLATTRTVIPVSKEYLQSLVNREVMTDDYDSHDTIVPKYSFAYNSRLNVANLKKTLFGGFNSEALFPYTNGYVAKYSSGSPTQNNWTFGLKVQIHIRQDGKEIAVEGASYTFGNKTPLLFLYHPNPNAYEAILSLYRASMLTNCYKVPLEPHPTLNGAYYIGVWGGANISQNEYNGSVPQNSSVAERTIDLPNKIYTSEVNNPFFFPALGINTVGTGTILGISSAIKALSQGQFGQFPLYAFTDEGVWALEVSSSGTYSARQSVARDVCNNPKSITQIDTAVLFTSERGVMLISGSNTICISEAINAVSQFNIGAELSGMSGKVHTLERFLDYIADCRMLYDYTHQRIIVYNPNKSYAYIYSLKSKQWGMMSSNIQGSLNSYPDALALTQISIPSETEGTDPTIKNRIVNYSVDDTTPVDENTPATINAVLVTRPLKLDAPDMLKTVDTIIQRGYFRKGHVKTILYGSRDLFNWQLVYSSNDHYLRGFRGTPYKYFRIALLCTLEKDESIFGCTVQYTPRLLNQPR